MALPGMLGIVMASGSMAQAALVGSGAQCTQGTAQHGVSVLDVSDDLLGNADDCFGAFSGNNDSLIEWNGMTWAEVDRWEMGSQGSGQSENGLLDLNMLPGGISGSWSFSGDASSWESFFIVTKAANDPGWAAYFFDIDAPAAFSGTFTIPWQNSSGGSPALSHLGIFAKSGTVTVPEPGTLALLGLGMIGLGVAGRRRAN